MFKKNQLEKHFVIEVEFQSQQVNARVFHVLDRQVVGKETLVYIDAEGGNTLQPPIARLRLSVCIKYLYKAVDHAIVRAQHDCGDFAVSQVQSLLISTVRPAPLPVDASGWSLESDPLYKNEAAAMIWLPEDQTSDAELDELSEIAARNPKMISALRCATQRRFWAIVRHTQKECRSLFDTAHCWVELDDYLSAFLTGTMTPQTIKRNMKECYTLNDRELLQQWSPEMIRSFDNMRLVGRHCDSRNTHDTIVQVELMGTLIPEVCEQMRLTPDVQVFQCVQ